ncbi:hypothetical protein GOODEAATRI_010381 [Goodea atripinnis]|uniref:Uncharacterized protein n=1 Tax=Goodea atripinnis TaxID=208336 RepID=A0ABV0PCY7_9TELE
MTWASIPDASWTPPSGGVQSTSHREEAQGTAQDTLEGQCLLAGLGTPWAHPGGAGGGVWGEGSKGVSTESAGLGIQSRMKWKTMNEPYGKLPRVAIERVHKLQIK